ncbi:hypothetical protein Goarm_017223, partial [Gossypium armourianum]|nr:hypothetical protein [Gossypium armourianum]
MGLHSVTIKGDSRTIIKKCQTKAQDKTGNSLAHRIAKEALRREEETHLEGEALHCLQMSPE